ncbi:MAG: hypothetical protein ACPIOQ_14895, partial [Promethearchaeia archaeon]
YHGHNVYPRYRYGRQTWLMLLPAASAQRASGREGESARTQLERERERARAREDRERECSCRQM